MIDSDKQLLDEVIRNPDDGALANRLLTRLFEGLSLNVVVTLLISRESTVAERGAWLASELGDKCAPIYDRIAKYLRHASERVRFWLIDCVLVCAGERAAGDLATVVTLLEDESHAVRWKAMQFLSRASTQQLRMARDFLTEKYADNDTIRGLNVLLHVDDWRYDEIEELISSSRPILRKCAAVAAARAGSIAPRLLGLAIASTDEEVRAFASDWRE